MWRPADTCKRISCQRVRKVARSDTALCRHCLQLSMLGQRKFIFKRPLTKMSIQWKCVTGYCFLTLYDFVQFFCTAISWRIHNTVIKYIGINEWNKKWKIFIIVLIFYQNLNVIRCFSTFQKLCSYEATPLILEISNGSLIRVHERNFVNQMSMVQFP